MIKIYVDGRLDSTHLTESQARSYFRWSYQPEGNETVTAELDGKEFFRVEYLSKYSNLVITDCGESRWM